MIVKLLIAPKMKAKKTKKIVMGQTLLNRLALSLQAFCAAHTLEEKWLIAPSRRVGFQWLDAVTRSGQPVLNMRVKTLRNLALDIAAPEMEKRGLAFARGIQSEVLISIVFDRLKSKGRGGKYLFDLEPSSGLLKALCATLADIRIAGVSPGKPGATDGRAFEVETKGREIMALLRAYENELKAGELMDFAGVLGLATECLKKDPSTIQDAAFVLLPQDMEKEFLGWEQALWGSLPESKRIMLDVDDPVLNRESPPETGKTKTELLCWLGQPPAAPKPGRDETAQLFRAIGEVNEVREVLRRCVLNRTAFDQVEILYTDSETYVPLIYETLSSMKSDSEASIPITFAQGIPARYSRPGKALMGWLSWIHEDFPQSTLVRMIQDGLFQFDKNAVEGFSFTRLGAMLRSIPIGNGKDRYLSAIHDTLRALEYRLQALQAQQRSAPSQSQQNRENDAGRRSAAIQTMLQRIKALKAIHSLTKDLLSKAAIARGGPDGKAAKAAAVLRAVEDFLEKNTRAVNDLDEYSRRGMLVKIREFAASLEDRINANISMGLDVWEWLEDMPEAVHVGGQGPRPGCLYVASLRSGGHSGRGHTYILGLDDTRFPGTGLQDPLLLDNERARISPNLATASGRLTKTIDDFGVLLARLRGNITMSYSCRNLTDNREMFPSPVILSAYRIISGEHDGDQESLLKWLPRPASFAPNNPDCCEDLAGWWLWRIITRQADEDKEKFVAKNFAHLGRGFKARRARQSDVLTEYDGYVPEAGRDLDPMRPAGPVLSASRLEKMGSCPMDYFFRYVLKIEPLEEDMYDPSQWLDPMEKGKLLHGVFWEFMTRLTKKELLPDFKRDEKLLRSILHSAIEDMKAQKPPPKGDVFDREAREMWETTRIFLLEEEKHCRSSRPLYFESCIGLPTNQEGSLIDTPDPISIRLPSGKSIRTRGIIDRIDEVPQKGEKRKRFFTVWDYKTGSSYGYSQEDPFQNGRRVQNVLYTELAQKQLEKVHPGSSVVSFGYFFPSARVHGLRINWPVEELTSGKDVLEQLCRMIANGCFPYTDSAEDVTFSDYRDAVGDVEAAAEAAELKLANEKNTQLEPFRVLRGYTQDIENSEKTVRVK